MMSAHTLQHAPSETLYRVDADLKCVPEHEATAAQIVRDAIQECGTPSHSTIAVATGLSAGNGGKVSRWTAGEQSPGLIHLVKLARTMPRLASAICRRVLDLCAPVAHVARPLPDRLCSVLVEVGDVAREIHLAMADGRVDAGERDRILREIGEARRELDRLERDLDAGVTHNV